MLDPMVGLRKERQAVEDAGQQISTVLKVVAAFALAAVALASIALGVALSCRN
jgi:hypothetical protein